MDSIRKLRHINNVNPYCNSCHINSLHHKDVRVRADIFFGEYHSDREIGVCKSCLEKALELIKQEK